MTRRRSAGWVTTIGRRSLASVATITAVTSFPGHNLTITFARAALALDVHLLVAGVAPTVGVLLLGLNQFLVPIVVGCVGTSLFHNVVDLASLPGW